MTAFAPGHAISADRNAEVVMQSWLVGAAFAIVVSGALGMFVFANATMPIEYAAIR